jgi:predicted dehydrogenase
MNNLVLLKDLKDIKVLEIKQFENRDRDRPDFDNKYMKMIYFFINEGIISTLRKYFAHRQPQQRFLTVLTVEIKNKKYLNISTQFQESSSYFLLDNTFYPFTEIDPEQFSNQLEYYLANFNQYAGMNNYALLRMDTNQSVSCEIMQHTTSEQHEEGLFIYGLGGYARMFIMHHFKRFNKIACVDYKAQVTSSFRKSYGFRHGFVLPDHSFPLLRNVRKPVAIIATYHSDHASLAYEIYRQNPSTCIFIEKPPVVSLEDLEKLIKLYNQGANIEIGFNRRFIDYSQYVRKNVENKIVMITCSIKEVIISSNHWYLWKNQGTRITGNVVHWFDLAGYWIQSIPVEINVMADPNDPESSALSVLYKNGSVLNITASDKGNSLRGVQEKIEIRYDNETIFIDDFVLLKHIKRNGMILKRRKIRRIKGHDAMYKNFRQIIEKKKTSCYPVHDLINTSVVTYYASRMLQEGTRNKSVENEIHAFYNMIRE